jgi:urease accessory protein
MVPLLYNERYGQIHLFLLHGFTGNGFLHPLTGMDHMLAMIAVGAWSAQLGKKNLIRVPMAFLLLMGVGGAIGISGVVIPYVQKGILLSDILLGSAIALNQRVGWTLAAIAVGIFGLCHGYAHGNELPRQSHVITYIIGFLITTACLHVIGAVVGLLMLEQPRGIVYLRWAGVGVFLLGTYLCV